MVLWTDVRISRPAAIKMEESPQRVNNPVIILLALEVTANVLLANWLHIAHSITLRKFTFATVVVGPSCAAEVGILLEYHLAVSHSHTFQLKTTYHHQSDLNFHVSIGQSP